MMENWHAMRIISLKAAISVGPLMEIIPHKMLFNSSEELLLLKRCEIRSSNYNQVEKKTSLDFNLGPSVSVYASSMSYTTAILTAQYRNYRNYRNNNGFVIVIPYWNYYVPG